MKKVLLVRENGTHMMIKKVKYEDGAEAEARRKIVMNMDMTKVYIQRG